MPHQIYYPIDEQKSKQLEDVKQQQSDEEPIKMFFEEQLIEIQAKAVDQDEITIKLQEVDWVEEQEQTNDDIIEIPNIFKSNYID